MTAFNEVLVTEQEAEQAINDAKREAVAAAAAARTSHQLRIEEEMAKLQETEQVSLVSHQKRVTGLVENIQSEVKVKIAALENRFATHKADLKSTLLKNF